MVVEKNEKFDYVEVELHIQRGVRLTLIKYLSNQLIYMMSILKMPNQSDTIIIAEKKYRALFNSLD